MKQIGITGGIGSGKTTVAKIFHSLGIPVYEADSRAKSITHRNAQVKEQIISLFGEESYLEGKLNRAYLSDRVFQEPKMLEKLNGIIHPAVAEDYQQWVSFQQATPYTLKEAAILYESGSYRGLDAVILVSAPRELRIKRVRQRDEVSREEVERRMDNQWTDDQKREHADYEIVNDENQSLIEQVMKIHEQILAS